jgi:EAL domain-containing protein (putative c-di-GMP-specific phosphodiesterase class I)
VQNVVTTLTEFDINPNQLIFEILDDSSCTEYGMLKSNFALLSDMGIQIAVGILVLGHFALHKVNQLPIAYLKIESRLVQDIVTHKESAAILDQIIMLAKSIKIGLITEGVEFEKQKLILQEMGCHVMQGNLFDSAIP